MGVASGSNLPSSPISGHRSAAAVAVADALKLDVGGFTYTGPAHYTLDHASVYRYRHTDVPPLAGARLGYNWMHNSDAPASWYLVGTTDADGSSWAETSDTDANGVAIKSLAITYSASKGSNGPLVTGVPLAYTYNAAHPLFFVGRVVLARYDWKRVSGLGTAKGYFYHRPYDGGTLPTESRPNNFAMPALNTWVTKDSVMVLNATRYGLQVRPALNVNDTGEARVARPCFDFASGKDAQAFISHEYIAGGSSGPGWKYFDTLPANTRGGAQHSTVWDVLNFTPHVADDTLAATLTEVTGAAIGGSDPFKGFQQEPQGVNLCTADNWLMGIGWGKASSTGSYTGTVPFQSSPGTPTQAARFEILSLNRCPFGGYAANQTALNNASPDTIVNATAADFLTRGWKAGDGVLYWVSNDAADGIIGSGVVASVTATTITLTTNLTLPARAAGGGRRVRLMRIPNSGDQVLLILNGDGLTHRTSITSVTLPSYNASFQDKDAILLALSANPPSDGGWAANDAGVHMFYWKDASDFGIVVTGSGTVDVAYDREAMRAAGLDDIAPHGLCLKLSSTSGNPTFDFGNAVGAASKDSIVSAFAKKASGSGSISISTVGSSGLQTYTSGSLAAWTRIRTVAYSQAGALKSRVTVNSGAGNSLYLIGMQHEQAAVADAGACPWSSPVVNPMNGLAAATQGATRSAKRMTRSWGSQSSANGQVTQSWKTNNFTVRLDFTPGQVMPNVTQALWGAGTATDGFALLLGGASGTTWTARKTIGGVNYDSTVTLTPVPGQTHSIIATWSDVGGTTFSVDGNAGSAQANTASVTALAYASPHDLGSLNNTLHCFGAVRKTPSAAYLVA